MLNASKLRSGRYISEFPIFYGWVVLAAAVIGYVMAFAGAHTAFSFILDDLILEFELNRTSLSGLLGLGAFIAAFSLPYVGRLVDRFGGRITGLLSGLLFALSLIGLSFVGSPLGFVMMVLFTSLIGMRPLQIIHSTVVAQWFRSNRGRVMGILVIALWLGQSLYVPWLQTMLATYDWRNLWRIIGLVIGLLLVPVIWLLERDRPERFGLHPDGVSDDEDSLDDEDSRSWTLGEARRTVVFWVFIIGRTLTPAAGSSLMLHQVSVFGVLGHSPAVAAQTFGVVAAIAAVGSIFAGFLMDRFRPGLMMMAQLFLIMLAVLMAQAMTETWMLALYALSFGAAIALGNVFDNVVWANLFGRKYLGEIRGYVTVFMTLGVTLGPLLAGLCYDSFGDYRLIFIVIAGLLLLQMILAFVAPEPRKAA